MKDPSAPPAATRSSGRRVLGNSVVLVVGDGVSKLGLFVLYALIARLLGKGGFGDYTLAVSLAYFVRASALGIDLILNREVARDLGNVHGLFWETIVLKVVVGLPLLAAVVAFTAARGYPTSLTLVVLLIGASNLIDVVAFSLHAVLRGRERMIPPTVALALETTTVVVLGAVALAVLDLKLVALGAIYVLAAVLGLLYIVLALRRHGIRPRVRGNSNGIRSLARVAAPVGVATVFSVALGRLDAVILSLFERDSAIVGEYGAAYRIFEGTLAVSWAFGFAIYPLLSRLDAGQALKRTFELACKAIVALSMPIGATMTLFGPTIVSLLYGSEFSGAVTATRILGGATALYGIFTVAALMAISRNRESAFAWIAGVSLAVNVVLNLLLIPRLGVAGAALAMTITQAFSSAVMVRYAARGAMSTSLLRIFFGPTSGLLAMALVAFALGDNLAALVVALAAYAAIFGLVERQVFPTDAATFMRVLPGRRERPAPAGGGGE